MTWKFVNIDVALPHLARAIMRQGDEVGSRLGERTMELINEQIVLTEPWRREVLVPGRGANVAAQIAETMWILAGRNDVEWLSHYLPRAKDFSDDGVTWRGGYGPRLRTWTSDDRVEAVDQVKHVIDVLTKDRSSRRAVISIYDPAVDTEDGKDIPCNDFLSFISREGKLHLAVTVRSNDLIWGWSGINQFEWSVLQEIVARHLGLGVGNLVFNTTSLHVYDRHWYKVRALESDPTMRVFKDSPRYAPTRRPFDEFEALVSRWFMVEKKIREGHNVQSVDRLVQMFPEPMFKSWLQVLAWYWSGDEKYLAPLEGTRLWAAVQQIPQSIQTQVAGRLKPQGVLKRGVVLPGEMVEPDAYPHVSQGEVRPGRRAYVYPAQTDVKPVEITFTPDITSLVAAFGDFGRPTEKPTFVQFVDNLHREKSAAYGDSWKKRGEQMSILANIARKIDRLEGGATTEDETSADTAIDLLVYLVKYRLWLSEQHSFIQSYGDTRIQDEKDQVAAALGRLDTWALSPDDDDEGETVARLLGGFKTIEDLVADPVNRGEDDVRARVQRRASTVTEMIKDAFALAKHLWQKENTPARVSVKPDYQNPYRNLGESDA